jgi:hypothetical protein
MRVIRVITFTSLKATIFPSKINPGCISLAPSFRARVPWDFGLPKSECMCLHTCVSLFLKARCVYACEVARCVNVCVDTKMRALTGNNLCAAGQELRD